MSFVLFIIAGLLATSYAQDSCRSGDTFCQRPENGGPASYCKFYQDPQVCAQSDVECTCLQCDEFCRDVSGPASYCKFWLQRPVCQGGDQDCTCDGVSPPPGTTTTSTPGVVTTTTTVAPGGNNLVGMIPSMLCFQIWDALHTTGQNIEVQVSDLNNLSGRTVRSSDPASATCSLTIKFSNLNGNTAYYPSSTVADGVPCRVEFDRDSAGNVDNNALQVLILPRTTDSANIDIAMRIRDASFNSVLADDLDFTPITPSFFYTLDRSQAFWPGSTATFLSTNVGAC